MNPSATRRPNRKRRINSNNLQPLRQEPQRQAGAGNQEVLTIKRRLLKLLVSAPQPLETVDGEAFQEFVKALSPSQVIPTKSVIRSQLLSVYGEKKDQLKSMLASAEDMVLTCESWSYRAKDSFLSVSCSFVDNHGNLRSYMLSTTCLFDDSADSITNQLCAVMKDWGVEEKVHSVVRAGLPQLKGVRTKWTDMPCFADTLDVIFKDLMSEVELAGVFKKCQNIVRFFKFDPEAEGMLRKEIQKKPEQKQEDLNLYYGDHWLLWLDMLERLIEQKNAMGMVFLQEEKTDLILDKNETEKVKKIISALKPLRKATSPMKTEGFQSVSFVLPLLKTFMDELREEEMRGNHIAKMLLSKSKKEFGNINKHRLAVYTILDPRFKDKLGEENQAFALTKIKHELPASQTPPRSAAGPDALLRRYMEYDPTSAESNPFSWWKHTGKASFGGLSRLALKKLGVVSTAVPLERAFSGAGEKFCNQRNAIEPQNLNMILFLNTNWSKMP